MTLAGHIASWLKPLDIVLLHGDLGMGKTAMSRGIIRALCGNPDQIVPSPTYTLVQEYQAPQCDIWHFDLYRTQSPDEIYEIGWEDALARSHPGKILLIEWPQRLGPHIDDIPDDRRIDITLRPGNHVDSRHCDITAHKPITMPGALSP